MRNLCLFNAVLLSFHSLMSLRDWLYPSDRREAQFYVPDDCKWIMHWEGEMLIYLKSQLKLSIEEHTFYRVPHTPGKAFSILATTQLEIWCHQLGSFLLPRPSAMMFLCWNHMSMDWSLWNWRNNGRLVIQTKGQVTLSEGTSLTVNCSYESLQYPSLFWYFQYPGDRPQLLFRVTKVLKPRMLKKRAPSTWRKPQCNSQT